MILMQFLPLNIILKIKKKLHTPFEWSMKKHKSIQYILLPVYINS